nr:hypothetical protein [Propionibacterium freudenreichii]
MCESAFRSKEAEIEHDAQRSEQHDAGPHLRVVEVLLGEQGLCADSVRRAHHLADHHHEQGRGQPHPGAGKHRHRGGGQDHLTDPTPARQPVDPRHVDQQRIGVAHAGGGVDHHHEEHREGDHALLHARPDAEGDQEHRQHGDAGQVEPEGDHRRQQLAQHHRATQGDAHGQSEHQPGQVAHRKIGQARHHIGAEPGTGPHLATGGGDLADTGQVGA